MAEEYPIIINGKTRGKLMVWKKGNKTVFDASCPEAGGMIRLSVFGEGREGYLGVMQPINKGMHIRRVLSPAELRGFPCKIEYAGCRGAKMNNAQPIDTLWRKDELGILYAEENGEALCAIPRRLGIAYNSQELTERNIEGESYRVYKIGKINRS